MSETGPKSILIIKPSSLGDIVHTLPAVTAVRRKWPGAAIRWVVNPEFAAILDGNPDIDEAVHFPRRDFRGLRGWLRLRKWALELRRRTRPDLVLDFQGLLRSALVARWTGGESWGTSDSRECARLFHRRIVRVPPRSEPLHAVERYLALVEGLGCTVTRPLEWHLPEGTPVPDCPKTFYMLHPFSRGAGKSLAVGEVEDFCRQLAPREILIVGRSDAEIPVMPNVTDLLNKTTLPELCWLMRRATLVVSVDSGPMHIAAALSPCVLAIHTWSDPKKVGPYNPEAYVWKDGGICSMEEYPDTVPLPRDEIADFIAKSADEADAGTNAC